MILYLSSRWSLTGISAKHRLNHLEQSDYALIANAIIQLLSGQSHWHLIPDALVPRCGPLFTLCYRFIFFRRVDIERMTSFAQREPENKTQGENVDRFFVRSLTVENLRCDPTVGTERNKNRRITVHQLSASQVALLFRDHAAHPKIGQFHHRTTPCAPSTVRRKRVQDVVWIQVPVNDFFVV